MFNGIALSAHIKIDKFTAPCADADKLNDVEINA